MNRIKISDLKKKNIHELPANYFEEQLPHNIQKRITSDSQRVSQSAYLYYYKVAALLVVGLIFSSLLYFKYFSFNHEKTTALQMDTIRKALVKKEKSTYSSRYPMKNEKSFQTKSEALIADIDTREILVYLNNLELEPTPLDDNFEE